MNLAVICTGIFKYKYTTVTYLKNEYFFEDEDLSIRKIIFQYRDAIECTFYCLLFLLQISILGREQRRK